MSENKKRVSPWVFTVFLGVAVILFAFYAVQSQSELVETKKELEQLKTQIGDAKKSEQAAIERQVACEKMMQRTLDEFVKSREGKK